MMFQNLKISHKLSLSYMGIGLATVVVISIINYLAFKKAIVERTIAQLTSINILKKRHIEEYANEKSGTIGAYLKGGGVNTTLLQQIELMPNVPALGLNDLVDRLGFDGLTIWEGSKIIYKYLDIAGQDTLFFYQIPPPSLHENSLFDASSFVQYHGTLIFYVYPLKWGKTMRYVMLFKKFDDVQKILFERTGMGETGESYLVGGDFHFRSASRFFDRKRSSKIIIKTKASLEGLKDKEGSGVIMDYRGEKVLSAYRRVNIKGLQWVIISEIDYDEALLPVHKVRNYIIIIALIFIFIIMLITAVISKQISNPIIRLKGIIQILSKGILPHNPGSWGRDEIGQMAQAIDQLIEGIRSTSLFASEIGNGNFNTNFIPLSSQDSLGNSLIQMRDKLILLQQKELNLMRARSSALLEGQEKERRRIAMELHDGIGQMLTVMRFKVAGLDGQIDFQKELKALIDETIAEVRRISNNVMPAVLLDFGLESALRTLCQNTSKYTALQVKFLFKKDHEELNINFETSVSLYRIVQEALSNTIKYAEASVSDIRLIISKGNVALEIQDDGLGFDLIEYNKKGKLSNGIKNMQERVRLLQGSFSISASVQKGTFIKINIPLYDKNNFSR